MSRLGHPHGQHQHSQQQPRHRPGRDRHAEAAEGSAPAPCSGEALHTRAGCGKTGLPAARVVLGTRLSHRYFLLGAVIGCQRNNRLAIPGAGPPQNEEPRPAGESCLGPGWGEVRLSQVFPAGRCDCLPRLTVSGPSSAFQELLPAGGAGRALPLACLLHLPSPEGLGCCLLQLSLGASPQQGGLGQSSAPGRGPSDIPVRAALAPPQPAPSQCLPPWEGAESLPQPQECGALPDLGLGSVVGLAGVGGNRYGFG